MYKIPLFDLNFNEEETAAVVEVLNSKWISTGPKTIEFEKLFASSLNVDYALATSNCTVALHLALRALGIGEGDEVICPTLTFVATVNAIKYLGATPVFVDSESIHDLTISIEGVKSSITSKTKAIIVMHFAGFSCDMKEIMDISKEFDLKVIEDACHAPLSEFNGEKLGSIGDIGCFSFFSNKNLSTGEGGMIVTKSESLFNKMKLLRSHGMTSMSYERSKGHSTSYDVVELGYNYRIDDIRSSIGIVQLKKLQNDLNIRRKIRELYIEKLSDNNSIIIPFKERKEFVSNYIFPIILKDSTFEKRENIRQKLLECGIQTSVHYPCVHKFSIYASENKYLPNAEYASDNGITLPMYSKLSIENIDFIVSSLLNLL